MTILGPILDDRTYEQLRDELVRRIPVYTPEWTNYNESDPGVALLELFAYLGESLLYRFNQIPDSTKVAFLNLLGARPRPPQVARALLAATTERRAGVPVLRGTQANAGAVGFETIDEVHVWPLRAVAVGKLPVEVDDTAALTDQERRGRLREQRRREDADARLRTAYARLRAAQGLPPADPSQPSVYYRVVAVPDDPTGTDPFLDVSQTVDQSLWVAVVADHEFDATQLAGHSLFLGVAVEEDLARPFDLDSDAGGPGRRWLAQTLTPDPPATRWELWAGPDAHADRAMIPLATAHDSTRGMTTTGVVAIEVPGRFPTQPLGAVPPGGLYSPPPIDDPEVASKVLAWVRATRPRGENDAIHSIRWVGLNAVEVEQAITARPELLGNGTAEPGQSFQLVHSPVVAGTVQLDVEEDGGWVRWEEVETLALSQAVDAHFSVDPQAGVVHFGTRSRVPQLGQRVRARSYRYGGGTAGNVPSKAIAALKGVASVTVANVLPATGGSDPVPLSVALDEVPALVNRRDRAVAAEDFTALAGEVAGVARAETLPLFHPDTPTARRAGAISVVVFPAGDLRNPAAPLPDTQLLRRVAAYLDPRRLVTTELYVIPPTYLEIALSVGIAVRDGFQVDAVRRWVELLLRQYLAPLPPFGPSGTGWPLGRTVRRAELEAIAVQVDGVDSVEGDLQLARLTGSTWQPEQSVGLNRWEVPQLSAITVVSGPPLVVGTGYTPAPNPDTDPFVVPLPPEVCR